MNGYHWLSLVVILLVGVALQRYLNIWGKVGLP